MVKPSTNKSFQSAIHVDARLPALKENFQTSKSDLTFRQPGSPAGSFPHTPWWHCVFYDEYERINVWSHTIPGVAFLILGVISLFGGTGGGATLATFCFCAACTHIFSALGHVYPDSHVLEKLDHIGIIALILGTPITALLAKEHGYVPTDLIWSSLGMLVAAFLPPTARVLGFASGIGVIIAFHYQTIMNLNLVAQLALYLTGGISFLRNRGHHRWPGMSDHHFLHYCVTVACMLHVWYILLAMQSTR